MPLLRACYFLSLLPLLLSVCLSCQSNSGSDADTQSDTVSTGDSASDDSLTSTDSTPPGDSDTATASDSDTIVDAGTDSTSASQVLDAAALTEGVAELLSLDDLDDGDIINALNGSWMTYDDRHDGGESLVWPDSLVFGGVFEDSAPGFGDAGYAARMTGTTGNILSWDYLGILTTLHADARCPNAHPIDVDLTQYDGIQFVAKGSATPGILSLKLPYTRSGPDNNCNIWDFAADSLTKHGDYEADFMSEITADWSLVRIPFSDFNQPDWAPQALISDVLSQLKELVWEYKVPGGNVDLWIDNVAFYKALPDPTDVYPRAVIESDTGPLLSPWFEPGTMGTSSDVAVTGQPFTQATQMQINQEPTMLWDALLYGENTINIKREDILYADFYARCIAPPADSSVCNTTFLMQDVESPYTQSTLFPVTVGSGWVHFTWPFVSKKAYDPGEAGFMFFDGYAPQTLEIGGFALTNYGNTKPFDSLPKSDYSYAGREADAPWRTAAEARIDTYRKGDFTILVQDTNGAPIPSATVSVEQKSHDFGFGTAINAYDLRDNLSGVALENYTSNITGLFNTVVLENALKWTQLDGTLGEKIGFPLAEWALDWTEARGLPVRGHTLVWPGWNNLPGRLKTDYNSKVKSEGEAAAAAWLEAEIEAHITTTVTRLKGRLIHWDVLNEPFDNHDLLDILGPEAAVKWFTTAKAADPDAKLFVNDYSILARKTTSSASRQNLLNTVSALIDAGAPIDGIGFQSHFDGDLTGPEKLVEILEQFAVFNKELWVSEFDLPKIDPALAADYTRDFMTVLFSHPSVQGFMMWGFWDGSHYGNSAPIYDIVWHEKPSGAVYRDLVFNQWRTSASGTANDDGAFSTRAFYGDYEVTVTVDGVPHTSAVTFSKDATAALIIQL